MVYFIQQGDSGPIKIGYTEENVQHRLSLIQCGSPQKLNIIGCISGDQTKEKQVHKLFREYRVRGEWFKPVEEIKKFCTENSVPLDSNSGISLNIRNVPEELSRQVRLRAAKDGETQRMIILRAVDLYLQRRDIEDRVDEISQ